jgi:aspartate/methionine/tyrosine aminotransferase
MSIDAFKLERYYAKYEFTAKYMFSSSDCESLSLSELLEMATPATLNLWNNLSLGYTESQGNPLLRAEIAGTYQNIRSKQIVVSAPEEAIFIAMQSLLSPEDEIIYIAPTYQSLYEIARSMGCKVIPWKLHLVENSWKINLDELDQLLTSRTRMLVINFPNNPTGYLPTRLEFDTIIEIARLNNLIIFSDEMYRMLEQQDSLRLPAVCDIYELGISLSGLSKAYALPGLRLGWLATQSQSWPDKFLRIKDYTTICNSATSEILAMMALQNRNVITSRNRQIIHENTLHAAGFFNTYPRLFQWIPPIGGSIAFPRWLGNGSIEHFCQEVVEHQGVMIVPGKLFDADGEHFRVGLGRKNLSEAVVCVENEILQRHP